MGHKVSGTVAGVRVLEALSGNAFGPGTLTVESVDSVAWTPNGGSKGAPVSLAGAGVFAKAAGGGGAGGLIVLRTSGEDLVVGQSAIVSCDGDLSVWEEIETNRAALADARLAQSVSGGDESVTRANLQVLLAEQRRLRGAWKRLLGQWQLFYRADMSGS